MSVVGGEVSLLVGPNGSGKSTVLRAVSGLAQQFEGMVTLDGADIQRMAAWRRHRRGLCHVPQRASLFQELTVRENLSLAQAHGGVSSGTSLSPLIDRASSVFPAFPELVERKVATLSGGERQMVALSRLLVNDVRVALVDEPTQGLAEGAVTSLLNTLRSLARDWNLAVLLVEHRVLPALAVSDSAVVLRSGRVTWQGPAGTLASDGALLRAAYHL
jgi:branched-chain amino acid transport system ATP-binding protein